MILNLNVSGVLTASRSTTKNDTWEVQPSTILSGTFQCPENTYKYQQGCRQCPANSSAISGSVDQTSCKCDANFYLEVLPLLALLTVQDVLLLRATC